MLVIVCIGGVVVLIVLCLLWFGCFVWWMGLALCSYCMGGLGGIVLGLGLLGGVCYVCFGFGSGFVRA